MFTYKLNKQIKVPYTKIPNVIYSTFNLNYYDRKIILNQESINYMRNNALPVIKKKDFRMPIESNQLLLPHLQVL